METGIDKYNFKKLFAIQREVDKLERVWRRWGSQEWIKVGREGRIKGDTGF